MTLTYEDVPLQVNDVTLSLSTIHHNLTNGQPPILFLHGFGSCKEDLADITIHPALQHRAYIAFDAPGCGQSHCSDLSAVSIPFLVSTAEAILSYFKIDKFHLIGHSMGGLTALLLADKHPTRVLSFIDIKGNLAPEDCFLSRQIFTFPSDHPDEFLDAFIQRTRSAKSYGSALYASTIRARVRAGAVRAIFESMVRLSDEVDLLEMFLRLPGKKMFMYGEENAGLSYLGRLRGEGVELAEIEGSGHFPMYSNPVEMYRRIASFFDRFDL
ncbi:hypothetical protein MW887_006493 [Aspergillus wentii]|nr:hypothetical protein MW887_006493 [Aspergillus wentii]